MKSQDDMLAEYEFNLKAGYDELQNEYDEQEREREKLALLANAHQPTKGNNMTTTTTTQAIETLKARAYADPTPAEIAAQQQKMDAEMLAAHGEGWNQRTTPSEAERTIRLERSAEYREASNANAFDVIKARDEKAKSAEPKPVVANWTQKYETVTNSDASVSYVRDGEEKIRDNGDGVQIVGSEKDDIRDAVRLGREKFGSEFQVNVKDETKREAILTEMAKQGVKPQESLMDRYSEIKAEVEKQRAEAELAAPKKEPEKQHEVEHEIEM